MSPKSLLRHELSVSPLEDLTRGSFARVIGEIDDLRRAAGATRVVFCSGKVYFDLLKARRKEGLRDVALVRIEQLYPFPSDEYQAILSRFPNAREVVWCQEEPQNQGAWYQIRHRLQELGYGTTPGAVRRPRAGGGARDRHRADSRARAAGAGSGGAAFEDHEESARETTPHAVVPGAGAAAPASAPKRRAAAGQSAPPPAASMRKRS